MNTQNKKIKGYTRVSLAIVATLLIVLGIIYVPGIRSDNEEQEAISYQQVEEMRSMLVAEGHIVHAGEFLDNSANEELNYTNSFEALTNCYENGNKFCELDFMESSDGELICAHSWKNIFREDGSTVEDAITASEFKACKVYGEFTTMTFSDVADFLRSHDGMYIVTDIKSDNVGWCRKIATEYEDIIGRFIIQIYHEKEYAAIKALGFGNVIYTLYKTEESERTTDALNKALEKNDYVAITVKKAWADETLVSTVKQMGVPVFVHTINDQNEMNEFMQIGVDGFYSDLVEWDY